MSRPINAQTWHRLTTSYFVRGNLMDWPDKGGHQGRPYHAVRGCRIGQGRPPGPPVPRGTRLPDRTGGPGGRPTRQNTSDGVLAARLYVTPKKRGRATQALQAPRQNAVQ